MNQRARIEARPGWRLLRGFEKSCFEGRAKRTGQSGLMRALRTIMIYTGDDLLGRGVQSEEFIAGERT